MDTLSGERLAALLEHLGIARAHFATQMPADVADLAQRHPDRVAGLVFAVPVRLDPEPFSACASDVLIVTGSTGVSVAPSQRAAEILKGAALVALPDYLTTGWSDLAKDRPGELVEAMRRHLQAAGGRRATAPAGAVPKSGAHAGITYRMTGSGPALVLLPYFLAPSQWDPIVSALAKHFTVIQAGGAHVGGAAILEARAAAPTYQAMFRTLVDFLEPPKGASILDVGCGSGALDRLLARRLGSDARLTAMDLNAYLIGEARSLAEAEGLGAAIRFVEGSAEALPFADASFDCVYSVTVLEECDANRAIGEMKRVAKPGGRIGVVVRAIDMPQWWNVEVPAAIAAKANVPPPSVGPAGVADRSLYARLRAAGLTDVIAFPTLLTLDTPGNSVWRYREDHLLGLFTPEERTTWERAREEARSAGVLMQANPMHCAVARKPA